VNQETRPVLFIVSREFLTPTVARYAKLNIELASVPHLKPARIIDYSGMESMLRDDANMEALEKLTEQRLKQGCRVYHLMSRSEPGFSSAFDPSETFDHLEQRRSVEVEEWLSKHAHRVDRREFADCAGTVVLETYDGV
jgi:hypothetical protein